jgi:uncharacterized protein (TIGR02284 family)
MATATAGTKDTVNRLIEICLDGERGFETAANAVNDVDLQTELMRLSQDRLEFAGELQRILAWRGEEPSSHGSAVGAMHRGWMNLKQSLSGDNCHAILLECERGEDAAVEAYRKATEEPLPEEILQVIESQYQEIILSHDHVRSLRDATTVK